MAPSTIDQAIRIAQEHHQAGRLGEADRIYRQVLVQQPNQADALHLLGVLAGQMGRLDAAVELIRRAITICSTNASYYSNLGNALTELGQLDEAIASHRQAIRLSPELAEAHNNLGNTLKDKGQFEEAIAAYRQAIRLKPGFAQAHANLGNALTEAGQFDEAIASHRQAIRLKPDLAEAHSNLGLSLKAKGQFDEAIASYRQALRLKPDYAAAYNHLGNALAEMGQLDEAIESYRQAIRHKPDYADAHSNLGNCLKDIGQLDEAIASYRRAIGLKPDFVDAHWNLALALLTGGDFQQGFTEYEWRTKRRLPGSAPAFSQPEWTGEDLGGRTILLYLDQGFGDAIQFVRYVPLVARRGGQIIILCPPELTRLFERLPDVAQVVVSGQPIPSFDVHCSLASLPRIFGADLNSIPAEIPYLTADPALVEKWSQRLGPADGRRRVGLTWAGNPQFVADRTRSLNLQQLAPFAAAPGVKFYSLQKGPAGEQAKNPPIGLNLVDLGPEMNDFADTAAVMSLMDLIITTDTSVPHLAGALGRPVWVMLQFVPDWRWLLAREDSPWYPTMRLFRQPGRGDWAGVVRRLAEELRSP